MATKKERKLIKGIADSLPPVQYQFMRIEFTDASKTHYRKVADTAPVNHYRRLIKIFDKDGFDGLRSYINKMTSIGTVLRSQQNDQVKP